MTLIIAEKATSPNFSITITCKSLISSVLKYKAIYKDIGIKINVKNTLKSSRLASL